MIIVLFYYYFILFLIIFILLLSLFAAGFIIIIIIKEIEAAVTNAYKQNWTKRENKKPRYNPEQEQVARGGGGRRGRARGGREGTTGRRGRGRPPIQTQPLRGQQTITAFLRK